MLEGIIVPGSNIVLSGVEIGHARDCLRDVSVGYKRLYMLKRTSPQPQ